MLNPEWRNLAQNMEEFEIRAAHSGLGDFLAPVLVLMTLIVVSIPAFISDYFFDLDNWTLGLVFMGIFFVGLRFIKAIAKQMLPLFILIMFGVVIYVAGSIAYKCADHIHGQVQAKIERMDSSSP